MYYEVQTKLKNYVVSYSYTFVAPKAAQEFQHALSGEDHYEYIDLIPQPQDDDDYYVACNLCQSRTYTNVDDVFGFFAQKEKEGIHVDVRYVMWNYADRPKKKIYYCSWPLCNG